MVMMANREISHRWTGMKYLHKHIAMSSTPVSRTVAMLLVGTVMAGCGQKGPLYLPKDDVSQQSAMQVIGSEETLVQMRTVASTSMISRVDAH